MKFHLMKHEKFTFKSGEIFTENGRKNRRALIRMKVIPSGSSEEEILFCENVTRKIKQVNARNVFYNPAKDNDLILSMSVDDDDVLAGKVFVGDGRGDVLEKLEKIFGVGNVSLEMKISNFRDVQGASIAKPLNISTKQLSVYFNENWEFHSSDEAKFQFSDVHLFRKFTDETMQIEMGGFITIFADVDTSSKKCTNCSEQFQVYRRMLEDEICSDAVILAKGGFPVKCHKGILSTRSSVLRDLFRIDGDTATIHMPEMGKQSVKAFLAYMYHWEISLEVYKNSHVAFDLLWAGHQYDIPSLEKAMAQVFLNNEKEGWLDVEVALKLFVLTRKFTGNSDDAVETHCNRHLLHGLKMEAEEVLAMNFSELEKLPCYEQLFRDEPKAAMELCKIAYCTDP